MNDDPLAQWQALIKKHDDLLTDPDGQHKKLTDLAMLSHRRRQIAVEQLWDMAELIDAARLWALTELEEADALGLFSGAEVGEDGAQRFVGGRWRI